MSDKLTTDEEYVLAVIKSDAAPSHFGEQLVYIAPNGLIFGLGVYYGEPLISALGFGIYAMMNLRLIRMQQRYNRAMRSLVGKLEAAAEKSST